MKRLTSVVISKAEGQYTTAKILEDSF